MNKMLMAVAVALALCGGPAYAATRVDQIPTGVSNVRSATEFTEEGFGGSGATGAALKMVMLKGTTVIDESARMSTVSATVLYPGAAFTQFTFVFPNDVRKVKVRAVGGSGTNFCHAGWSGSLTGSAVDAGTLEAYRHLPRLGGSGGGVQNLALASQSQDSSYEWTGIRTAGGFSTLFCGCTDTAAIGIDWIQVEYYRP